MATDRVKLSMKTVAGKLSMPHKHIFNIMPAKTSNLTYPLRFSSAHSRD